jgi:hypothetical protein
VRRDQVVRADHGTERPVAGGFAVGIRGLALMDKAAVNTLFGMRRPSIAARSSSTARASIAMRRSDR